MDSSTQPEHPPPALPFFCSSQPSVFWYWKLFITLPSVVIVFLLFFSGFPDHDFTLFGDRSDVGNRLDGLGLDHDSMHALIAAKKAAKHIKMNMHNEERNYPHQFEAHSCVEGDRRDPLPESLQRVLNFTTSVRTNLKIVFAGDYSMLSLSETYQESAGVERRERLVLRETKDGKHSHAAVHIGTTEDYGVVAGYYTTNVSFQADEEGNATAVTWSGEDIRPLLNYTMPWFEPLDNFDVLILQLPHQQDVLRQINEVLLREVVRQAAASFGVSTVIFVTLPMHEDYRTVDAFMDLAKANHRLRVFADNYKAATDSNVRTVFTLDMAHFASDLIVENALHLGMNVSATKNREDFSYLMERVNLGRSQPAVAHVCATTAKHHSGLFLTHDECQFNMFAADGSHWCMETMGGRLVAGVSCLMDCATSSNDRNRKRCEDACNEQFMSLAEIDQRRYSIGP